MFMTAIGLHGIESVINSTPYPRLTATGVALFMILMMAQILRMAQMNGVPPAQNPITFPLVIGILHFILPFVIFLFDSLLTWLVKTTIYALYLM